MPKHVKSSTSEHSFLKWPVCHCRSRYLYRMQDVAKMTTILKLQQVLQKSPWHRNILFVQRSYMQTREVMQLAKGCKFLLYNCLNIFCTCNIFQRGRGCETFVTSVLLHYMGHPVLCTQMLIGISSQPEVGRDGLYFDEHQSKVYHQSG